MNKLNPYKQETSRPTTVARNPLRGFIYGIVWLCIALTIGAVFIDYAGNYAALHETTGTRVRGFIMVAPFITLAASIFCFVRGVLALAPYKAYLRSTTPQQRRQLQKEGWKSTGPLVSLIAAITTLAYVGLFVLIIVLVINYSTITASENGTRTFVAMFMLVGLLAGFFTEVLVKFIRAKS